MSQFDSLAVLRRWLLPSLVDVFFCALLLTAMTRPGGWQGLLSDGDTGWHVRTGELVLQTGKPPLVDPFSFSRSGEPWFAWEWLSDVLFAYVWRRGGLGAVAALAGVILSLTAAALLAWLLRRGVGLWIGLAVALAAVSASSVHALARPHVFSMLFYTVALWMLDEDRRRPGPLVWALAPLCALWANLHAGFVALLVTLVLCAAVEWSRRYALVAAACLGATCVNPYGWRLHQHIVEYLNSSWIMDHVQEFQSPNIRSEGMLIFAALLLAGAALAPRAGRFEGVLLLVWGFAAMRSARHIPFFAAAAAPVIATGAARWWRALACQAPARSTVRLLWDSSQELGRWRPATIWIPLVSIAVLAASGGAERDFPAARFPVLAVERNAAWLAPTGERPRILTSDQWADYLIYQLYPRQRVFFDGRSDFYGPSLGADYRALLSATGGWREALERYRFERALLPRDWPLSTMLDREPAWRRVYEDEVSTLFVRDLDRQGTMSSAARSVNPPPAAATAGGGTAKGGV